MEVLMFISSISNAGMLSRSASLIVSELSSSSVIRSPDVSPADAAGRPAQSIRARMQANILFIYCPFPGSPGHVSERYL